MSSATVLKSNLWVNIGILYAWLSYIYYKILFWAWHPRANQISWGVSMWCHIAYPYHTPKFTSQTLYCTLKAISYLDIIIFWTLSCPHVGSDTTFRQLPFANYSWLSLSQKSKGLSEILRDIRTSIDQMCRIKEKTNWTTIFTNE